MGLETGTYINSLNAANPTATDLRSEGDDHLRLIKSTLLATFPNITGALTPTHTELNYVTGVTSAIQTQFNAKAPLAAPAFTGAGTVQGLSWGLGAGAVATNTVFGSGAFASNVSGGRCTAVGYEAASVSTAGFTTAYGYQALKAATTGYGLTAIGYRALLSCTTGLVNTAVGDLALSNLVSYINCTGLGSNSQVTGSHQVQLGDSATTTYVYGTVQNRSDLRDKADVRDTQLGLGFILALRPVDYRWDLREDYKESLPAAPDEKAPKHQHLAHKEALAAHRERNKLANITKSGAKKRTRYHHGFIAQDLLALPQDFGGVQNHALGDGAEVLTVGYDELIAPLVKALQELNAKFEAYVKAHP